MPDKAIDLIDEACSNLNLENRTLARRAEAEKELADLSKEKEVMMATASEDAYKRLADIRSMELRLEEELLQLDQETRQPDSGAGVPAAGKAGGPPQGPHHRPGRGGEIRVRRHPPGPGGHFPQA